MDEDWQKEELRLDETPLLYILTVEPTLVPAPRGLTSFFFYEYFVYCRVALAFVFLDN